MVGRLGREGEGPGEFRIASGLARGPNGTIGVFDFQLGRMTVFNLGGVVLSETKLPPLFVPAPSFFATISGYRVTYPSRDEPSPDPVPNLELVELEVNDGRILWARRDLNRLVDAECPVTPGPPSRGAGWVLRGCQGALVFLNDRNAEDPVIAESPTYVEVFPNEREVADYLQGLRFITGGRSLPASVVQRYEREFRETPKSWFVGPRALVFDSLERLWVATTRDRDNFSYLDIWIGTEYAGTVRIRDRLMGYDILGSTLAALVERKPGPDGVALRAVDWYDIGDVEFGN